MVACNHKSTKRANDNDFESNDKDGDIGNRLYTNDGL